MSAAALAITDAPRREITIGLGALIGFFGLFLGWASFAPLDAAVVAPGVIVVSGSRQTLQHQDGGVVSKLLVEEGKRVQQGDILIELSAPEVTARKQALLSQQLDLQMQRESLIAEAEGREILNKPEDWKTLPPEDRAMADVALESQNTAATARLAALARQGAGMRAGVNARVAGYRDEIAAVDRQKKLLADELDGVRTLTEKGLAPITRLRSLERSLAELDGRRAQLRAQIAEADEDRAAQIRDIEAKLSTLSPQLAGARSQLERTLMRAPVSGSVVGLTVHTVGGVITPGQRVLDIVPEGQALVVEAQVKPDDADDLKPGQTAEVRVTAFHGRDMPIVKGRLKQVSADRFTDQQTGRAYFTAQVEVPPEELKRLASDGKRQLRAGLSAEIMVPTRKRTALEYLLEPLNQTLWRSFRET
jgi:HlyD family secretion protein